jgi:heat shock protein HtpX
MSSSALIVNGAKIACLYGVASVATGVLASVPLHGTGLAYGTAVGVLLSAFHARRARDRVLEFTHGVILAPADQTDSMWLLGQRLHEVTKRLGLPTLRLALLQQDQPVLFMAGLTSADAVLAISQAAFEQLTQAEVDALVAHEIAHLERGDAALQTITASFTYLIGAPARFISSFAETAPGAKTHAWAGHIDAVVAALAGGVVRFMIDRNREFDADRRGAEIAGDPITLSLAIQRIENGAKRIRLDAPDVIGPLPPFNPLAAHGERYRLFSTHPATVERQERLRALAAKRAGSAAPITVQAPELARSAPGIPDRRP